MFYYIVITLFNYCVISQNKAVILKGTVTMDDGKDPVENAIIHLKLSSGTMLEEKTDALGQYTFSVKDTVSNFSITLGTDKSTRSLSRSSSCFFASTDEGKGILKANTNFVKNFQLVKVLDCGSRMPTFVFATNSILSCNDSLNKIVANSYESFQDAISFFYQTLKDNPTIIIELQGHASSLEKNHELLSLYRAQLIGEVLIAKGINKNRIKSKGWGNHKLLIKDDIIKKAKTCDEKMALHLKNQRVVFRIISWDFKENSL